MDATVQKVLSPELVAQIENELAAEGMTPQWKAHLRDAYAAGDINRIIRLLRPLNRFED